MLAFGLVLAILVVGAYALYSTLWQKQTILSLWGTEEVRPTVPVVYRPPTLTVPADGIAVVSTGTPRFDQPTPAPPTQTLAPQISDIATIGTGPERQPTASATYNAIATVAAMITLVPPTIPPPTIPPPPPTATPFPTPIPVTATPSYLFYASAAGPDYSRGCNGFYVFGYLRDQSGTPLPGLRLQVWSQYAAIPPVTTKVDPPGQYDAPISQDPMMWYVQVVDAGGAPLSPAVEVYNSGHFVDGSEACWHQVDFTRGN